jgi:uncharacterized protein
MIPGTVRGAVVGLLVAAAMLIPAGPTSAQAPAVVGTIPVPGASALLVATGGSTRDGILETFREQTCEPSVVVLSTPGGWVFCAPGAPAFVNAQFPGVVSGDSTLFVRCRAEIEVRVAHGDIVLAGTLSLPPLPPPFPAVVLISGSGPQDRDEAIETLPGYRPFRWIADHLQAEGVAVLRYDDRGVAQSTGEHLGATSADFADDAEAVLEFLRNQRGIAPDRVGMLGHSEGGLIAAMVAARNQDVAFVVSMGGPGLDGDALLEVQSQLIMDALGLPPEVAEQELARSALVRRLTIEERWDELEELLRAVGEEQVAALPEEIRRTIDLDAIIETQMIQNRTWMRFFLTHDPAKDWARVTVPVLALFGGLDLQVPEAGNRERMEEALATAGNADVTVVTFPTANHLFQEAVTGSPEEYAHLPMRFVPDFLSMLAQWLQQRFGGH